MILSINLTDKKIYSTQMKNIVFLEKFSKKILKNISNRSIVMLIDEYDAPLTHNINNQTELNNIMCIINNFYAVIKEYTSKFRFIFITGVTLTSHISIFSAFNNLRDISIEKEFNTLLGFTKKEIHIFSISI